MILSNTRFACGLNGSALPTSPTATSEQRLGLAFNGTLPSTKLYAIDALLIGSAAMTLTFTTGIATATTWVAGAPDVETATIVVTTGTGGVTSNGTMTLVVTSAGMAGSPLSVPVALTPSAHGTAALITTAARTALAANATIAARFTVSGSGVAITLTRKGTPYTVGVYTVAQYGATDSTLNIAIPGGLGITAAGTSAATVSGTATSGAYFVGGLGKDFEGEPLSTISTSHGLLLKVASGTVNTSGEMPISIKSGGALQITNPTTGTAYAPLIITGVTTANQISIVVAGS